MKQLDEAALMKAATFDSMDTIYSPNGGHIVVVAVLAGVPVCWQCGEPFDQNDGRYALIEKKNDIDTSVPVGVHRKCFNPAQQFSVGVQLRKAAAGILEKTKLAKVLAGADRIANAALESAKKVVL